MTLNSLVPSLIIGINTLMDNACVYYFLSLTGQPIYLIHFFFKIIVQLALNLSWIWYSFTHLLYISLNLKSEGGRCLAPSKKPYENESSINNSFIVSFIENF